jgi:hypothetical protein
VSHRPPSPRFVPAATLVIAGGLALFFLVAMIYVWPVLSEPVPEGSGQEYLAEQVRLRLAGKVVPMLAGSFLVAGLVVSRWNRR